MAVVYTILALVIGYIIIRQSVSFLLIHSKMGGNDESKIFGEIIDKSLFEDSMIQTAEMMRKSGKSIFTLESVRREMSTECDKYVFITMYRSHASIVVIDKGLFNTLFFEPVWSQMVDETSLRLRNDSEDLRRMMSIPQQQYHITLDENGEYRLSRNMYYIPWLQKSRSFYVGETALGYLHFQLLSLVVVPSRYRLVMDDCLEFAKRFASKIAIEENGVREKEVEVLFRTLIVSESYTSALLEQRSRNDPRSALTGALSYFVSFKTQRLLLILFCTVLAVLVYELYQA